MSDTTFMLVALMAAYAISAAAGLFIIYRIAVKDEQ